MHLKMTATPFWLKAVPLKKKKRSIETIILLTILPQISVLFSIFLLSLFGVHRHWQLAYHFLNFETSALKVAEYSKRYGQFSNSGVCIYTSHVCCDKVAVVRESHDDTTQQWVCHHCNTVTCVIRERKSSIHFWSIRPEQWVGF